VAFARKGFEVAMTETGITNENENWMKQRDARVAGRMFRCTVHLKKGSGGTHECVRVHFAIHGSGAGARLVLGHGRAPDHGHDGDAVGVGLLDAIEHGVGQMVHAAVEHVEVHALPEERSAPQLGQVGDREGERVPAAGTDRHGVEE
jgi:hypothetical protein